MTNTFSPKEMANASKNTTAAENTVNVKTVTAAPSIKTENLKEPTPSAKPAEVLINTAQQNKSVSVQQVNDLCEKFIMAREGSKVTQVLRGRESTYAERSIKALSRLLTFIWANQNDIHVLDAFRKFMVKHRSKHLACENALQGINLISSDLEKGRYQIMYILMFELTNPDRLRNDFDFAYAEKVCYNANCNPPNGYIQFISSRLR